MEHYSLYKKTLTNDSDTDDSQLEFVIIYDWFCVAINPKSKMTQ